MILLRGMVGMVRLSLMVMLVRGRDYSRLNDARHQRYEDRSEIGVSGSDGDVHPLPARRIASWVVVPATGRSRTIRSAHQQVINGGGTYGWQRPLSMQVKKPICARAAAGAPQPKRPLFHCFADYR